MQRRSSSILLFALCITGVVLFVRPSAAATVGFESLPLGTIFDYPTYDTSDLAFSENNVQAYIQPFFQPPGAFFLNLAQVYNATDSLPGIPSNVNFNTASGHVMYFAFLDLEFDFTGLGFSVNHASFDYANGGGLNLSVNGASISTTIPSGPTQIAPGVTLTSTLSQQIGHVELNGPISRVRIGGVEFAIDNLIATPEPMSALPVIAAAFVFRRRLRR